MGTLTQNAHVRPLHKMCKDPKREAS